MTQHTVWMSHPNLPEGQDIEIPASAAEMHRAAGWVLCDPPPPDVVPPVPGGPVLIEPKAPPSVVEGVPDDVPAKLGPTKKGD